MSTTRTIFECFKILVTAKSSSLSASPSQIVDKGQQFNESLVNGLATLETFLENQTAVEAISEEVRQSLKATISHPECLRDVRWQHTKCLLLLLESLHSHLLEEIKVFKKSQIASKDRRPGDIPPLAPDTLSIGHQQVLSTVLQFVVSLGVCTYLSRGVGIPFN
ncbi:putative transport and Golgi organization protein 6-like [Apostichopus japonicus]|uniref:Putative transport and Golgi organization protein 6-like n=1 Tax=Stichopus japonicus TaxID=307972 RepID=A0A2G8LNW5_STIJA|nr:putative transport and Golgi organization protein 6-like [Apostichopus japonicus]